MSLHMVYLGCERSSGRHGSQKVVKVQKQERCSAAVLQRLLLRLERLPPGA